jgi:hypothetical protein
VKQSRKVQWKRNVVVMLDPVEDAIPSFEILPILYLSLSHKVPEDVNVQQQGYGYLKP